MRELNDLERIELEIEKVSQRIRSWQRKAKILEIDSSLSNRVIDEMLTELSELMKKRDHLKE